MKITHILILALTLTVTSCNTTRGLGSTFKGLGQDVKKVGSYLIRPFKQNKEVEKKEEDLYIEELDELGLTGLGQDNSFGLK
jgi:predicted small secreted protein